jgi:Ca2+-binding RTX toxin-like protein
MSEGDSRGPFARAAAFVIVLGGALAFAPAAAAATINVNSDGDGGPSTACELRDAVLAANGDGVVDGCPAGSGPDTIVVPAGSYRLALGHLVIASQVTIDGAGAATTTVRPDLNGRVVNVTGAGDAEIRGLTITGGVLANQNGLGILNEGSLTLRSATVSGNQTFGGLGAGIYNDGVLTLIDTTVANNQASQAGGEGGGIYSSVSATATSIVSSVIGSPDGGATPGNLAGDEGGGIYLAGGSLTVRDSLIARNEATNASMIVGGGAGGGIRTFGASSGAVNIVDSTIARNEAGSGGGVAVLWTGNATSITGTTFESNFALNAGGGARLSTDTTILNSTFSGNDSANNGGGLFLESSVFDFDHSTLAANTSPLGPAIRAAGGTINLRSSLVGGSCSFVGTTLNSLGYNVAVDLSCGLAGPSDLQGSSIGVGPLADNGGRTRTHALQDSAVGVDRAPCAGVSEDQRGTPRPFGARCDSGAYELARCGGVIVNRVGTAGPDALLGTAGPDGFLLLGGDDVALGLGDSDAACGSSGNDRFFGGKGRDRLLGGAGADRLLGGAGADRFLGGAGADRALGGPGPDRLFGGPGPDRLFGQSGPDRLLGGAGRDRLLGGRGRDLLIGGPGRRDLCNGGAGRDRPRTRGCERVRKIP